MDGIIRLFLALIVLLLAFGVAPTLRRRLGVDPTTRHCPPYETPMSTRRASRFRSFTSWENGSVLTVGRQRVLLHRSFKNEPDDLGCGGDARGYLDSEGFSLVE